MYIWAHAALTVTANWHNYANTMVSHAVYMHGQGGTNHVISDTF